MTGEQAVREFFRDDELYDKYERAITGNADAYKRAVTNSLESALSRLMLNEDGTVRPTDMNRQLLAGLSSRMESIYEDAGLVSMVDEIFVTFENRLDTMNDLMKRLDLDEGVIRDFRSLPEIDAHIRSVGDRVSDAVPEVSRAVQTKIVEFRNDLGAGNGVKFEALTKTLTSRAGVLPEYGKTIANTELGAIDSIGRDMQADRAGINKLRYSGILDGLTRPFCSSWLGKVKTREFWKKLQNDTNPQPALIYRGGYNCRHRLMPWLDEWENPSPEFQG